MTDEEAEVFRKRMMYVEWISKNLEKRLADCTVVPPAVIADVAGIAQEYAEAHTKEETSDFVLGAFAALILTAEGGWFKQWRKEN